MRQLDASENEEDDFYIGSGNSSGNEAFNFGG